MANENCFGKLPKVSVIITNFNCGDYLPAAIRSVAGQTYTNLEAIVVDDGSADDSREKINETLTGMNDSRFRSEISQVNIGQMGAMAVGLRRSDPGAPFVCFFDSDDVMHERFVERHVSAHLNSAHVAGFSSSDMIVVDAAGAMVMGTIPFYGKNRGVVGDTGAVESRFSPAIDAKEGTVRYLTDSEVQFDFGGIASWRWVGTSSLMFRRALVDLILPENDSSLRVCADYYFVVFSQLLGGSLRIADCLSAYRIHGRNNFARNMLIGGRTPLADRDWNDVYAKQEALILAKLDRDRDRFVSVLGRSHYDRVKRAMTVRLEQRAGWPRLLSVARSHGVTGLEMAARSLRWFRLPR